MMRKHKLLFRLLSLIFLLCSFILLDKLLRQKYILYAAWRQPDQRYSNWSNTVNAYPLLKGIRVPIKADFSYSNLFHIALNDKYIVGSKFTKANMQSCYLYETIFKNCDLKAANLKKSRLNGTSFIDTALTSINLSKAEISSVIFINVDLTGANLHDVQWRIIRYDKKTRWPKGFKIDKNLFSLLSEDEVSKIRRIEN